MENSDLIPLCVPQTWLRQLDLHLTLDSKKLSEEKKKPKKKPTSFVLKALGMLQLIACPPAYAYTCNYITSL